MNSPEGLFPWRTPLKTCILTLLRHSNATKPADKSYAADQARVLTDDGYDLARARRAALGNQTYALGLSSPAKRAMDTVAIVGGFGEGVVMDVPEFGIADPMQGGDAQDIDEMFNELAYDTLKKYREHHLGRAVIRHGDNAAAALKNALDLVADQVEPSVLVGGHAVCIPAMAYVLARGKPAIQKQILNSNLDACEGYTFTLNLEDSVVSDFKVLGAPVMADAE